MKRQIQTFFNAASTTYDSAATTQRIAAVECAEHCAELVGDTAMPLIVEIGSGTGILTQMVAKVIPYETYIALDLADEMLSRLDTRDSTITPMLADGENTPLKEGCADLLVSSATMQWYSSPARSISANLELLKPGGCFSLAIFIDGTFPELARCSELTGFGSVMNLKSAEFYTNLLEALPNLKFQSAAQQYIVRHTSVMAFLKSHRKTGARFTSSRPEGLGVGRKRLQAFCQTYTELFADEDGTVPATYSILYLWGRKEKDAS